MKLTSKKIIKVLKEEYDKRIQHCLNEFEELVDDKGNDRFEYTSQATYTWSASDKKVTTSYTITEKSLVDVEAKDESGNNM